MTDATAFSTPITHHAADADSPAPVFGIAGLIVALKLGALITWGLPGLAMVALAMVPVMFTVLLLITVGK